MRIALGFSRTNTLISKTIRWFTNSQISHTYVRMYVPAFRRYVILHADWDGVKFELAEKFDIENVIVEEYIIDHKDLAEAIAKNLWHLGKKYDYVKIFNWAWAIILRRWFVRKVKDPGVDPKKLICVDFNIYMLNDANITNLKVGEMTPIEFAEWCRDNHERLGWRRVVHDDSKTLMDHVKEFLSGE